MRRRNPPNCKLDVLDYGVDEEAVAFELSELMDEEFLDWDGVPYWMALAVEACIDPDDGHVYWVALWTIDTSEYLVPNSAQIGLCVTDNVEDIKTNIRTSAGATAYSTDEQRMFAMQHAHVYFSEGSKKTGLGMLMKAGTMLEGLEEQTLESADERGFEELIILAIGAEDKRRSVFNRALKRFGYQPMGDEFPSAMPKGVFKYFT